MTAKNSSAKSPSASSTEFPAKDGSDGAADNKNVFSEHKGKLAIGVAATLGIMIFYNWRQKNLSKEDPEGYARLQRIKDSVKTHGNSEKHGHGTKHRKTAPANPTEDPGGASRK